jgi:hypothetical protein
LGSNACFQATKLVLVAKELKKVILGFRAIRKIHSHHHIIYNRAVAVEAVRPFYRVGNETVQPQNETSGFAT